MNILEIQNWQITSKFKSFTNARILISEARDKYIVSGCEGDNVSTRLGKLNRFSELLELSWDKKESFKGE